MMQIELEEHTNETFFENILKLEQSHNLIYNLKTNSFEIKRYFDIGVFHKSENWILDSFGKAEGEAIANLPKAEATAKETLKTILELDQHPGKAQAVGVSALTGMQAIPFTNAGGFMNKLKQLKGKSFLQAFETLKGGGQITETEGTKATDAINRLDNWTTEAEFQTAVDELKEIAYSALEKSYRQAGKPVSENFRAQIDAQVKPTPRSKGFAKKAPVNKAVQSQFQIVDDKK